MSREEALACLSRRASEQNLLFIITGSHTIQPVIETVEGPPEELDNFQELFGGIVKYASKRNVTIWLVHGEPALTLTEELLQRKDFKRSGKWWYAKQMLLNWEKYNE